LISPKENRMWPSYRHLWPYMDNRGCSWHIFNSSSLNCKKTYWTVPIKLSQVFLN